MRLLPVILMLLAPACADAQTRATVAPTTVERAYQAALLHSPTPLSLRRDQAEYLRERAEAPGPAFAEASDETRLAILTRSAEVGRKAARTQTDLTDLTHGCVDIGAIKDCEDTQGGWLSGPEGERLYWQNQVGFTDENGLTGGIVFLVETGGRLSPVAWAHEGARSDAPVVFDDEGDVYIAVPGLTFGAGRSDADVIFRWTSGAMRPLTQIDSWSWRDDLATKLPGLNAFGRVRIDYQEMVALTEMFREGDAGCCGTGGHALINFAIEGDRLTVSDARLRDD